jgi:hypothetical protein
LQYIGTIGGIIDILIFLFSFFVTPISKFSFFMSVISNLYVVKVINPDYQHLFIKNSEDKKLHENKKKNNL